jgi:hypothetical protein
MKESSKTRTAAVRREIDVLFQASEGMNASALLRTIAIEAVASDEGNYTNTAGEPGFAWNPEVYVKRYPSNPVEARIHSAAGSLGRVLGGAGCDARSYSAFLEGIYRVTVNQDHEVTRRIEELWDCLPQIEIPVEVKRPSRLRRILRWLEKFFLWHPYHHNQEV